MRTRINPRLLIGLVMALIAVIGYYSKMQVNPITGEKQHISITPEQEVALGLQSAPQMAAEFGGLYNDPKVQQMVKEVGQRIVQQTEAGKSDYRFDFHVLADNQTINAFALPGGQIFITMALLSKMTNQDQLAGVLGHEIGHVVGRHSAEHMAQGELMQGLVQATTIATYDPSLPGSQQSAAIAQYVGQIVNMKFGREDELESDKFGVKYMMQCGYRPEAMIEVMEILKQASGGRSQSEFMSTHPSPENRVEHIKQTIEEFRAQQGQQGQGK